MKFTIKNLLDKFSLHPSEIGTTRETSHKSKAHLAKEERKVRKNLSEKKIDKMIKDSFPASDPPSTY